MAKSKADEWLEKDKLTLLTAWARDGLTDEQIANNMGIARGTLYEYKNKFIDINDALKKGKEVVDIEVENALLKRAKGYKYEEVTKELRDGELVVTKKVTKEVLPDVTAQIYWLKNRKPDKWREKVVDTENEEQISNAKNILFKIREMADNGTSN